MLMKQPEEKFWKKIAKKIFKRNYMTGQGDISGSWFNPKTGQTVMVRQMISDGNESFIQTDQGMLSMNEFTNFIQMGDDIYDQDGNKTGEEKIPIENIFSTYEYEKPDMSLLNKPLTNNKSTIEVKATEKPNVIEVKTEEHQEKDINEEILDRAFAKIEGTPRIVNVEIDWDGLPLEKIKSMIELMDLSVADVSKYILKKYFKTTNIIENKITKELI